MLLQSALIVAIFGRVWAKPAEESFYLETRRAPASGLLSHRVGHDIMADWVSSWARQDPSKVIPTAPPAVKCEPKEQDWDLPESWTDGERKKWRTRVRDELRRRRHIDCSPSVVSAVPNLNQVFTTTPAPRRIRFTTPRFTTPRFTTPRFLQEVEAPAQQVGRVSVQEAVRAREQRLNNVPLSPAAAADLPRSPAENEARDRARWEQIGQRGDDVPSNIPTPRSDDPEGGDGDGRGSTATFSCVVTDARGHNLSRSRRDTSYSSRILNALVCRGYSWLHSLEKERNSLLNHIY